VARDDDAARRETLRRLMQEHVSAPFPSSVEKGRNYGLVDPVMIGADIYGWCDSMAHSPVLPGVHVEALRTARDDLHESLMAFPEDARAYYAQLIEMATAALGDRA